MLDVIDEVGPGGEFLSHPTTAKGCRSEVWLPKLMDRRPYDAWAAAGGADMAARVRSRVQQILTAPRGPELAPEATREIERVLAAAKARATSR